MKKVAVLILGLFSLSVNSDALKAPVGVRPCCAFGMDLKAQLGSVPVPFFKLENVLGPNDIGTHQYNDGSESVASSLFGFANETNGVLYTELGGFIDTAHVRDTADYTYFLYRLNQQNLGKSGTVNLPTELRSRQITWYAQNQFLSEHELNQFSAQAAALIAFRLAQWHEIAQWFGLVSVSGFKEYASAFSSEDLYSNMLGARLAKNILLQSPNLSQQEFQTQMDLHLQTTLTQLRVQPKEVARQKLQQLDGQWWDSQRRLPDKWVVLFRDYDLALTLLPHAQGATVPLSIEATFANGQAIEQWVQLELVANKHESAFAALPSALTTNRVWHSQQFQLLADFARAHDEETKPRRSTQSLNE